MDRKTVYALVIIGVIFVGWMYLTMPSPSDQAQQAVQTVDTVRIADTTNYSQPFEERQRRESGPETQPDSAAALQSTDSLYARFADMHAEDVVVETDKFITHFSTKGAALTSFKFKDYFYHNGDTSMVEMVPDWAQSGLKFAFPDAGGDGFYPDRIVFSPNKTNLRLSGGNTDKLILDAELPSGDIVEVEYTFYGDRYDFGVRFNFEGAVNYDLGRYYTYGWRPGLESTEKNRQDDFSNFKAIVSWENGVERYSKFDHGKMSSHIEGKARWYATKSKYFMVAVDPDRQPEAINLQGDQEKIDKKAGREGYTRIGIVAEMPIHQRKSNLFDRYMVFIGPMDYDLLKSYDNGFQDAIDMGWSVLKPLSFMAVWVLKKIHDVIPNYGFVIIIFAILIKIVLYPLTAKSYKSMAKMSEIQPKMKAIQEKYKSEPQKMNAEVMKLYKENKINPVSGCLPMLLQMPILIALFNAFRYTILLRGADFMLWMQDLSQPDQIYRLPIIMAGTMFIQQKLTMKDPKQRIFMILLPAVMLWFSTRFSTGLVLYWTMFNLLSILEILFIRKPGQSDTPVVSTVKPGK